MYGGFIALVLILLALDLGVFRRTAHVVSVREAMAWSAFWIAIGITFAVFVYLGYGRHWLGLGLTPDLMTATPQVVEGVGLVYSDGSSATVKYPTGYLVIRRRWPVSRRGILKGVRSCRTSLSRD